MTHDMMPDVAKLLLKQAFRAGASSVSVTERDNVIDDEAFEKWYSKNFTVTKNRQDLENLEDNETN
jgi:hypothetical protein